MTVDAVLLVSSIRQYIRRFLISEMIKIANIYLYLLQHIEHKADTFRNEMTISATCTKYTSYFDAASAGQS